MGTDREMDADTGGTQITDPATFPAADATYYAQWTEKAAVDVTFTSGEGVWNDGTIAEKKVPTKPDLKAAIPGTVSRAGYSRSLLPCCTAESDAAAALSGASKEWMYNLPNAGELRR